MLFQQIASKLAAIRRLQTSITHPNSDTLIADHTREIDKLVSANFSNRGLGLALTKFDHFDSSPGRLVFTVAFCHMDQHGTEWTSHSVIVTPSLVSGFGLRITGQDHKGIKGHIADCFNNAGEQK